MTTGSTHGQQWGSGARDWAALIEVHLRPLYEAVVTALDVTNGTRVLDIGCGPGGGASRAAARGATVAGLDAAAGSIEVARERMPDGDFRVGDMEALPWEDASFDAVMWFNSLQFAGNPTMALREGRRVLKHGGRLGIVIWAPRDQSQQPAVIAAVSALAPPLSPDAPGPFALSAPGVLESRLADAGLQPLERGEVPEIVEFSDEPTALRATLASGAAARAIQHSGEERVREAILRALEPFKHPGGGYRMENRFRFVIAA